MITQPCILIIEIEKSSWMVLDGIQKVILLLNCESALQVIMAKAGKSGCYG